MRRASTTPAALRLGRRVPLRSCAANLATQPSSTATTTASRANEPHAASIQGVRQVGSIPQRMSFFRGHQEHAESVVGKVAVAVPPSSADKAVTTLSGVQPPMTLGLRSRGDVHLPPLVGSRLAASTHTFRHIFQRQTTTTDHNRPVVKIADLGAAQWFPQLTITE
jgi:hypothetical protein